MIKLKNLFRLVAVILIICLSIVVFGQDVDIHLNKVEATIDKALDDAVILTFNGQVPMCSGQLVKNNNGKVYVYSAGHCCESYKFIQGSPEIMSQIKLAVTRGGNTLYIDNADYDQNVDVCRMDVLPKHKYDLKTSVILRAVTTKLALLYFESATVVSAFPEYDRAKRISTIFPVGYTVDKNHVIIVGQFYPGMSGSAIINEKGNLVGLVSGFVLPTVPNLNVISAISMTKFVKEVIPDEDNR